MSVQLIPSGLCSIVWLGGEREHFSRRPNLKPIPIYQVQECRLWKNTDNMERLVGFLEKSVLNASIDGECGHFSREAKSQTDSHLSSAGLAVEEYTENVRFLSITSLRQT
ncbi:hypothetical protein J6590_032407 [Homalodisca vitripennis]|nr:hypothetical protein J6590_032407 [Homalodisca vitripennis]